VTDAVHDAGGTTFAQLWHVGRISHTSLQPNGRAPVSSSAKAIVSPKFQAFIYKEDGSEGRPEPSGPRALRTDEVARSASAAGFDEVELHAANN
jgi:2,4-dienoyl-CoA reductase-like NADH-dependent reductase (Old Yellow Enzyme family)